MQATWRPGSHISTPSKGARLPNVQSGFRILAMGSVQQLCGGVLRAQRQARGINAALGRIGSLSSSSNSNSAADNLSSAIRAFGLHPQYPGRGIHATTTQSLKAAGRSGPDTDDKHGGPPGGKLQDPKDGADDKVGAPKTSAAAPHDAIGEEQRVDTFVMDGVAGPAADETKSLKDTVKDTVNSFGKKVKDMGDSLKGAVTSSSSTSDSESSSDDFETLPSADDVVEKVGDTVKGVGESMENTGKRKNLGDTNIVSQ